VLEGDFGLLPNFYANFEEPHCYHITSIVMASHSLVLECLRAVRFRLAKARSIMQANNLTPQVRLHLLQDLSRQN